MRWILHQMRQHLRDSWWMVLIALVAFAFVSVLLGPLEGFTFALVLGTLLLASVTALLATANQSLVDATTRTEIREALKAAIEFIEIEPGALLDVLKGGSRSHPFLDAIDKLASYANLFHDKDTERDVQQFALEIDNKKTETATPSEVRNKLTRLQGRVVQEMVLMRRDLRTRTREYLYP